MAQATGARAGSTAQRLTAEARRLIMSRGYNGFSYADLAAAIGIRKPSIHFHFPTKADLACAVIEQARSAIRAQIAILQDTAPEASSQLRGYTDYWRSCIRDGSAPFCLAAILAAELPSLPADVAAAVRGHFEDLTLWLTLILALGAEQSIFRLDRSAGEEADIFIATTYGAMLAARAFDAPDKFAAIADASLDRLMRR